MFRVILCVQFYRLTQLIFSTLLNEGKKPNINVCVWTGLRKPFMALCHRRLLRAEPAEKVHGKSESFSAYVRLERGIQGMGLEVICKTRDCPLFSCAGFTEVPHGQIRRVLGR